MKKNLLTLLVVLFSIVSVSEASATQKNTVISGSYIEGFYFWGYLSGDPCLYLMYFGQTTELDYSGRPSPAYYLRIIGESDYYVGFPTKICPGNEGEWFV